VIIIIAVFVGASGCTLILAGTLALVGRGAYREWRAENEPAPRRRRRRSPRRDEDDDRDERDDVMRTIARGSGGVTRRTDEG
jgi:hypothetical protein